MPDFVCRVGTENGEILERKFSSENRESLRLELEQKGFYIFSIKPAGFIFFSLGRKKKIKEDDFIIFNQEMRALLKAGLPATRSLDILIGRQGDSDLGLMIQEVRNSIETGATLSEAFANHRDRLPAAYVSTLIAGERSGELADAIDRYVKFAKLTSNLRKNFKKALYYPLFLIILSIGMMSLMLFYVLPEFSKFYEGFKEELPGFTLFVLGVANFLRTNWLFLLAGLVLAILAFRWWKSTTAGRRAMAVISLNFPILGNISHKFQLSQIFHSLAVMLQGGMPLVSSLEDLESSSGNPILVEGLQRAGQKVREGESLTGAIGGTALDTDLSVEMIEVGESTGALPEMLSNIAGFYDEEVKTRLEGLLTLVEPILLLLMATMIGSLLFAMYYPLFNLIGRI